MAALPYAGDPERAKIKRPLREVRASEAAAAILIGVWPLLLLPPWRAVLALLAAALVVAGVGTCAKKRVGGVTGDVLGAGEQLVEAGVLMALCAGVRP
jgi:adenosylcobinamide-GDP ribazoletransferase